MKMKWTGAENSDTTAVKGSRISCCVTALKAAACICAALGWWGVLYPELTLTPDTYVIVGEETAGGEAVQKSEKVVEWDFTSDIYEKLLEAEAGQIQFKSRLLLMLRSASGENGS